MWVAFFILILTPEMIRVNIIYSTLHISSISCSDKYKGIPHFSSKNERTYSVESILAPYKAVFIGA